MQRVLQRQEKDLLSTVALNSVMFSSGGRAEDSLTHLELGAS